MKKQFDLNYLESLRALTVEQAAFYAATSREVVMRWLRCGDLGYYVLPNTSRRKIQRRILKDELIIFLMKKYRKERPRQEEKQERPIILEMR